MIKNKSSYPYITEGKPAHLIAKNMLSDCSSRRIFSSVYRPLFHSNRVHYQLAELTRFHHCFMVQILSQPFDENYPNKYVAKKISKIFYMQQE